MSNLVANDGVKKALLDGDLVTFQRLLAADPTLASSRILGYRSEPVCPIHIAAHLGRTEALSLLVSGYHIDPNDTNGGSCNAPLCYAAEGRKVRGVAGV